MLSDAEVCLVDDVLEFWFADIGDSFEVASQNAIWYGADEAVDRQIKQQFGQWVDVALEGKLKHWQCAASSSLALVLLLDQFTRNIYRRSRKAFSGDEQARDIVRHGLALGYDRQMTLVQRSFFLMPFEHSESLADQELGVALFQQLLADAPNEGKTMANNSLAYAEKHRDIVQSFGRFPHRNAVYDRQSTDAEQAYLEGGGARFGQ